jgi:hypothetical protein
VNPSLPLWFLRAVWVALPLTLGVLVEDWASGRSAPVAVTGTVFAWAIWAGGLLASLITLPAALTALRTLVPLPVVAGTAAAVNTEPALAGWVGLAAAGLALATAMSAEVGRVFIDGASYGDEQRFGLRPPGALLLGPLPLVWVLTALALPAGALMTASRQWIVGPLLVVAGSAGAWWGSRAMHQLAKRFLVFVPAGVTLVDEITVGDPVLFRRSDVVRVGPAPATTEALDLTAAAAGLILQLDVDPPVTVVPNVSRTAVAEPVAAASVLVAPSRPGAFLAHADERNLAVQRG